MHESDEDRYSRALDHAEGLVDELSKADFRWELAETHAEAVRTIARTALAAERQVQPPADA